MKNLTMENLDCENGVPSIKNFWKHLVGNKLLIFIVPLIFCSLIIWIYWMNLRNLMKKCPISIRTNCLLLVSIYPIASLLSLTSIAIPRAYFFNDSMSHIAFMVFSWAFYRLCMTYVDGETNFITISDSEAFTLRAPPLCCCLPFKRQPMTKDNFKFIKFLIIQLPITHILIFMVLNIIYVEDIEVFDNVVIYFIPFIGITVISGVYGYNLMVRTLAPYYKDLKLVQKYFAFQLVLFFCKIFPLFLNIVMKKVILSCNGPFTIVVKRHIVIQILVQIELLILSLWSLYLYDNPVSK